MEEAMASIVRKKECLVGPDPIVIDLLINLAATGIASLLVKVIRMALQHQSRLNESIKQYSVILQNIEDQINRIEKIVNDVRKLIEPGAKRELGGLLLLTPELIQDYHRLRDTLFDEVRTLDEMSLQLDKIIEKAKFPIEIKGQKPTEFKKEISYIEKRLREARVASLSAYAFFDIKSSLDAMRLLIKSIHEGQK